MGCCVMCGEPIPDEQDCCSMCYGDPEYGNDGYYQAWLDEQERQAQEKEWAIQAQAAEQEAQDAV